MKTKKLMLMALLTVGFSMPFVSCNDDELSEEEKEAARWSLILENDLGLYAYDMSTLGYVSDKNGAVDTNLVGATVKTLFTDKKI